MQQVDSTENKQRNSIAHTIYKTIHNLNFNFHFKTTGTAILDNIRHRSRHRRCTTIGLFRKANCLATPTLKISVIPQL